LQRPVVNTRLVWCTYTHVLARWRPFIVLFKTHLFPRNFAKKAPVVYFNSKLHVKRMFLRRRRSLLFIRRTTLKKGFVTAKALKRKYSDYTKFRKAAFSVSQTNKGMFFNRRRYNFNNVISNTSRIIFSKQRKFFCPLKRTTKKWRFSSFNFLYPNKLPNAQPGLYLEVALKFTFCAIFWDQLAHKLKRLNLKYVTEKVLRKTTIIGLPRFDFKGVFVKRPVIVRKNEVKSLLTFRLLHYFSALENSVPKFKSFTSVYYASKKYQLPSLNFFELKLVTSLLRSGFFENGYVVNSLIQRNVFLVNGLNAEKNISLQVWDIITVVKPVWWLVYARFINFFSHILGLKKERLAINRAVPRIFVKKILRLKSLFQKRWTLVGFNKIQFSQILLTRNFVLTNPPSYMEVSFKLFIIVIHKLLTRSSESTIALTSRNAKFMTFKGGMTHSNNAKYWVS
jgi:hypothetical protein